jgi:hypothetical protein
MLPLATLTFQSLPHLMASPISIALVTDMAFLLLLQHLRMILHLSLLVFYSSCTAAFNAPVFRGIQSTYNRIYCAKTDASTCVQGTKLAPGELK